MFLFSKLPNVLGQSPAITEIDVGQLRVPVTFDGQVQKDEWYSDSKDYQSIPSMVWNQQIQPIFHFRTKRDAKFTYQAVDIPNSKFGDLPLIGLEFDTKNVGSFEGGADGVYNLTLSPSLSSWIEESTDLTGKVQLPGTPFFKLFTKGQDYDWVSFLGPSPINASDHLQFEFKYKNEILLKNAIEDKIGFAAGIGGFDGTSFLNGSAYLPMIFKQQVLPEFDSDTAVILSSLVGVVAATRLSKKRLSRRGLFGIH